MCKLTGANLANSSVVKCIIFGLAVIGIILAIAMPDLPSPPAWLMNWTTWLLAVIGAVFGPGVLLNAERAFDKIAKTGLQSNKPGNDKPGG